MSFEKLKFKRILITMIGAFLAVALVFAGAFMLLTPKDMSRISCQVLSTDNGDYYNATNGGRVFIGGTNNGGASTSLGVKNGSYTTITAVPSDGYGFAGFYNKDQTQLLSLEKEYEFQVSENTQITAKFAKLYPLSLTLEDPFEENKQVTINKLCYVGECISTYDLVNEFYGEEYAVHFQNSTASPLDENETYEDFVLAQSAIVVGAESANLKIQPTDPENLGADLPGGYNQESEYLFLYTATGIRSYGIGGSPTDGFWNTATRQNCKIYELVGDNNSWCYFDPLDFEIQTNGRYIVTGIQMRYYNMEKYYDASMNWHYKGWTSYVDATKYGIYSDEVGAVQVEIKTAVGKVATFYSDATTVFEQKTYAQNTSYSMPTTLPEKEGFTFAGWTNNKESNSIAWKSGTKTLTNDVSWYPVWERRNVISYNYLNASMQKATYNDTESTQAYFSCVDAYPDKVQFEIDPVPNKHFVYAGKTYDFVGYALDNTANTVYGSIEDVNGLETIVEVAGKQINLYGVYRTTLNITYDPTWGYDPPADGSIYTYKIAGSAGIVTPEVVYQISSQQPINDQGEFKGWLYGKTLYNAGASIKITGDITLSAKWEFHMILTGQGTYANPYTISTVGELQSFMACVNDGRYNTEFFKLLNDIEVNTLEPIGYYDSVLGKSFPFKGVFDGGGHTITTNINLPDQDYVGLFGYNEGTIENLNVAGSFIGKNYVGAVCGYNTGIISSCQTDAIVKGHGSYIGGIIGVNEGGAEQLYAKGQVTALNEVFGLAVGGVIGINLTDGIVRNAINEAVVSANNYQWVGGIAGQNHGSVENFYNAGNITGAYYVGGIVGQNGEGSILNGYNIGKVNSLNTFAGAIAGSTNNGNTQYLYYFMNSAYDGSETVQKAFGTGTLAQSTESDPKNVQSIDNQTASAIVIMDDGSERSLLWALNIGIEFFASSTGGAYCNWVEVDHRATIFYNNQWNASSGEGTTTIGWTGTGTLYDPYEIGAVGDILLLSEKVSLGMTYKNSYFKMTYDIDFSAYTEEWNPIGGYNGILGKTYAFEGTFNGGGHAVVGLNLSVSSNYVGLFGYSSGIIQNLIMKDCKFSGVEYVGSVVGYNAGKIINCTNLSEVNGTKYVGGVTGYNAGIIDKTVHNGHVKITSPSAKYIGGLTGFNKLGGNIRNSYSTGEVSAAQNTYVGGLVGQNDGVIVNCYNQGAITGSTYVGGIVGYNNKACMYNVYSSGTVTGTNNYAGSLIGGSIDDKIQYAYFLIGSATDGANQMQTGVGTEQLGYFTELDEDVFSVFDEDGNVSQTQINQQIVENFVWALNLGRQVFDIEEPETLVLWSQTSTTFPVLQEEGVWNSVTFCTFEGHGTKLNPFLIRDAVELYYFSIYVNMGNSFEGQYFRMENDIQYDTSVMLWSPIGHYDDELKKAIPFAGEFDGNYHKITGININYTQDYLSIFGYNIGTIKNLGFADSMIYGDTCVGGICAYNAGTVENCYSAAMIIGHESYVGGIVGVNDGIVDKCYMLYLVTGGPDEEAAGEGVGGIVGHNRKGAHISNSFIIGTVSGDKAHAIGGIVGINEGRVTNSFATYESFVDGLFYVGGIAGKNQGTIECGYSAGLIEGFNTWVGGIAGQNTGTIKNTFYLEEEVFDANNTPQHGIGCEVVGNTSADILSQTAPFKETALMYEDFYVEGTKVETILEALLAAHAIISAEEDKYPTWRDDDYLVYPVIHELGNPPFTWLTTNAKSVFSGDGTEANPYIISTVADLKAFASFVNAGRSFTGEFIALTNNIDVQASATNLWTSIGNYDEEAKKSNYFAGTFDGNGYTISGIYISQDKNYQGVFGYSTGTIKNLTVEGIITGASYVGGIAGFNTGTIINCVNKCTVNGSGSYVGGIAGVSSGKIEKCYTVGAVTGTNSTFGLAVGGIAGINLTNAEIKTSFVSAKVTAKNYQWVGGIAGQNHGDILNCYTADDVEGSYYVGGVVGQNGGGILANAISYGKVKGSNTYIGGVVGYSTQEAKLEYTYYLADNATDGSNNIQGGIGQSSLGAKLADANNVYMAFNKQLKISSTNIEGTQVDNVLDALNIFALSDRANGRANDSWQRSSSGYPVFGFHIVWDGETTESFAAGNGTKENPYQIASAAQLKYLQRQSALGETYENTYFVLTNDIYLNNISITSRDANVNLWEPIQDFAGYFDGQNYAVHGIFIVDRSSAEETVSQDYKGLFGNVSGTILNVCTFDGYIEGFQFVGGLAGASEGAIINCFNNNTIIAYGNFVGGIVGQTYGLLNGCGNYGNIVANGNFVGGIVGKSTNVILNSYNLGNVASEGQSIGGIVGISGNTSLANCYNTGEVIGNAIVGGIVGENTAIMTNCYNTGIITGTKNFVGSLVGSNNATLSENFYLMNSSSVSGVLQGAVGSEDNSIASDKSLSTTAFNDKFMIPAIRIGDVEVSDFVQALNTHVMQNPIVENVTLYKWEMSKTHPVHKRFWQGGITTAFSGGDGTEANPYQIASAEDLTYLATRVNNGEDFFSVYFVLKNDIIFNDETFVFDKDSGLVKVSDGANVAYLGTGISGDFGGESQEFDRTASSIGTWYSNIDGYTGKYTGKLYEWTPIGTISAQTGGTCDFAGFFDGNGHTISGLYVNSNQSTQGLFGQVSGVIKNFGITNSYIAGNTYVGGIAGDNRGTITNVFSEALVFAKSSSAGGICGYLTESAVLSNAYTISKVFAPENAGSLVGEVYGTVENAYSYGETLDEEKLGKVIGKLSGDGAKGVYVWTQSALADNFTEVTTENYADVVIALNNKAEEKSWYQWSIAAQTGVPSFVTKTIWNGSFVTSFAGGSGTEKSPYLISNASQLAYFASIEERGTHAKLTNDIYLNDETFEFVSDTGLVKVSDGKNVAYFGTGVRGDDSGSNSYFDYAPSTKGVWYTDDKGTQGAYAGTILNWTPISDLKTSFDGNGFTIYGMYSGSGFIDTMTADLKNLTIANSFTYNQVMAGGFVGKYMGGTISNCINLGIVIGGDVGGIVSKVSSDITTNKDHSGSGYTDTYTMKRTSIINSKNLGVVIGANVGGIVGYGEFIETITDCFNVGPIYSTGKAAGIIYTYNGRFEEMNKTFTISNSHNYAQILGKDYSAGIVANLIGGQEKVESGTTYKPSKILISNVSNASQISGAVYTGGIIGYADRQKSEEIKIQNATNSGEIEGLNYTGGIVGRIAYATLENATNTANVQGLTSTGGIVGYGAVAIAQAENTGDIEGLNNVGGIMGYLYDSNYSIKSAFNFGNIEGTSVVGGIAGKVTSNPTIEKAYTSGNINGVHTVGGLIGEIDSGTVDTSYSVSIVNGDYFIGGIAGNSKSGVVYKDCFYPYGLVTANSCAEREQTSVGVAAGETPQYYDIDGTSRYIEDTVIYLTGATEILDKQKFLISAKVEEQGAGLYVVDNKDNYCLLDGKIIVPSEYGINPTSGRTIIMAYKAKATVTLYANGQGMVIPDESGWAVNFFFDSASKVLYANQPIGEMPMMYDEFYTFDGWYIDSECLGQKITSASVYDFRYTKLYAKWIIETFTITINTEDICAIPETSGWWISEDGFRATKHLTSLDAVGKLPVLEKEGYTFEGWFMDPEFNYRISPSSLFWAREDTTMYPKLTPNSLEFSIRLNDVEWLNSGINVEVYKVVDSTETLVWSMENIQDGTVKIDKALEKGFYKVYASRKADKLTEMHQIGAITYVEGQVNFVIDYYSLTLTKGDVGINSVYIAEENEVYVNGQDIHNNAQIYLRGQSIVISAVVAEGNGFEWSSWVDSLTGNQYSTNQDLEIESIDQSFVFTATSN